MDISYILVVEVWLLSKSLQVRGMDIYYILRCGGLFAKSYYIESLKLGCLLSLGIESFSLHINSNSPNMPWL